jgi:acyl carrier protein
MNAMDKNELVAVILTELRAVCEENGWTDATMDAQTTLFGEGAVIDSMALVGLIIKVEEYLLEKTGQEVQVIDDDAIIADAQTPFKNAERLASHALAKVHAG